MEGIAKLCCCFSTTSLEHILDMKKTKSATVWLSETSHHSKTSPWKPRSGVILHPWGSFTLEQHLPHRTMLPPGSLALE